MTITPAAKADLPEILRLQYQAYQSEAQLCGMPDIPPLTQTLDDLEREYAAGVVLKAMDEDGAIVGSVRGRVDGGTLHIGKLIVRPDRQGQGLGTRLLLAIEAQCPHRRCELFTSAKSVRNLALYGRLGYAVFAEKDVAENLRLIFLEK